jgi:hypothetical protein
VDEEQVALGVNALDDRATPHFVAVCECRPCSREHDERCGRAKTNAESAKAGHGRRPRSTIHVRTPSNTRAARAL